LQTELDKELAKHEEFVKRAKEEIESLKSKSSFKNSWKNKFFKAQEEVERLNQGYDELNYEFAIKEECIERLKGEKEWHKRTTENLTNTNEQLIKQVEVLTEEKQLLFQANVDTQEQLNTLRLEKKRENAELQKQVEELKEENEYLDMVAKQSIADSQNLQVQVDELKNAYNDLLDTCRNCDTTQAVKDTAKEIYTQMLEWIPIGEDYSTFIDNFEMWLKERYGLEVE
jgi:chromosome segregation ATPase